LRNIKYLANIECRRYSDNHTAYFLTMDTSEPSTPYSRRNRSKTILDFDKIRGALLDLKDRRNDTGVFKCIAAEKVNRCRAVIINLETNAEQAEEVWSLLGMKTAELVTKQHLRKLVERLLCREHAITKYIDYYVEFWHWGKLPALQTPVGQQPEKNASAPAKMTKTLLTNRAVSLGEISLQLDITPPSPSRSGDRSSHGDDFQDSSAEESPTLRKSKRRSEDKLRTPTVKHRRTNSAPPRPFESLLPSEKTMLPETPSQTSHSASDTNETTPLVSPASSSRETLSAEDLRIVGSQQRPWISSDDSRADDSSRTSLVTEDYKSISDKPRVRKRSPKSALEIDERIRTVLRQDLNLTKGEQREKGVIYVLKNCDKPQSLKIGITTRSIWERKQEVGKMCHMPLDTVYDRD